MPYPEPPKPISRPEIDEFATGLSLINPWSRKGFGPGIIVVVDQAAAGLRIQDGVPSPAAKWAEESYTVVEIVPTAWDASSNPIEVATAKLAASPTCEGSKKIGVICYSASLWPSVQRSLSSTQGIAAVATYADATSWASPEIATVPAPLLAHLAGASDGPTASSNIPQRKTYHYPEMKLSSFATPFGDSFDYATEAVSHTRNLTFLKNLMGGPYFDLEDIWEEHTYYEFENRSVEFTMNTMVEEPYVNHVPTLTGGIGRRDLTDFYANHFIFSNPEGTSLELISRTVGVDRVVDEFIMNLNHNQVVDWLLPGVPPTYRDLAIPMMAVVNIRGDRLYHEHITWDQATALRQAGLLPEYLPWTDSSTETHSALDIQLPVAGIECVQKMRDKNSVPSNAMFGYKPRTL